MKIILSHDVDNITRKEHKDDLIIIKMIIRGFIEFFLFRINLKTLIARLSLIRKNDLNNINQLVAFDKKHNTKSTYFFATSNDKTLAYKAEAAKPLVKHVRDNGLHAGIHGIAFDNLDKMKDEYAKYKEVHGDFDIGIRIHYLRKNENTLTYFKEIGYLFDTTEYSPELKQPYITEDGLVEIPFHIMDSYLFQEKGIQKLSLNEAISKTKKIVDENKDRDIILNINFHQEYFSKGWDAWKEWYIWFVEYAVKNNIPFTSYKEVVHELTSK